MTVTLIKGNDKGKMNYAKVVIPADKKPENYTYRERRASLLKDIQEVGHPKLISQTELCKKYGVSQGQISQDITHLENNMSHFIADDVRITTQAFYSMAIKKLIKADKLVEAGNLVKDWNNYLFDIGAVEKVAKKIDASLGVYPMTLEQKIKEMDDIDIAIKAKESERKQIV